MVVPLHGYHLHCSSVAETQHGHLASHIYHGLAISWLGLLGDEPQHGPPQLAVHEDPPWGVHPHEAPDGAYLTEHPLLACDGWFPLERAQRAQDPEEHTPHEHRDHHEGA